MKSKLTADQQERLREDAALAKLMKAKGEGRSTKKLFTAVGVATGVLALIVAGIVIGPSMLNQGVKGSDAPKIVPVTSTSAAPIETVAPIVPDFPFQLQTWQSKNFSDQDGATLRKDVLASLKGSDLVSGLRNLPTEAAGYTTDPANRVNDDGSIGMLYSPWTLESISSEARIDIERLINPVFGGWAELQNAWNNGKTDELLKVNQSIFSSSFLKSHSSASISKWMPTIVDWNANSFGATGTDKAHNWFGKIQSTKTVLKRDLVETTSKIQFQTVGADGSIISRTGTLKLSFVPNRGTYDPIRTVLISKASFKQEK